MYFIKNLKFDFPKCKKEINEYDVYLHRYFTDDELDKIFDVEKENYQIIHNAWQAKNENDNKKYMKYLSLYGKSLNNDLDFLIHFAKK